MLGFDREVDRSFHAVGQSCHKYWDHLLIDRQSERPDRDAHSHVSRHDMPATQAIQQDWYL
jgi:hypothetical protein